MGISKFKAEALRSIAFGSVLAPYAVIGTAFEHPISKIHVTNTTDALLVFSFDGIDDHFVLPTNAFILLDITMESKVPDYIANRDAIYVKRIETPTAGSVYLSAFYGVNK